jgi:flagella basal body P-ring formation protein FlgA
VADGKQDAEMASKNHDNLNHACGASRPWLAVALLAGLGIVCLGASTVSPAVRMWPKSVVDGDQIRVEHVAQVVNVMPELVGTYAAVVVKPAPEPGRNAEVTLDELRDALIRAGANPAEFTVCGAPRCDVVRPLTLRPVEQDPNPAVSKYWWGGASPSSPPSAESPADEPADSSSVVTVATSQPTPAGNTLEGVVSQYISDKLANMGGRIHVRFSPNVRTVLSLSRPEYDFRIHWRTEQQLGPVSLEVDVLRKGHLEQSVPMVVEVSLTLSVAMAARPINRGQVVRSEDVQLHDVDFYHLDRIGLTDLGMIVGQQARRFVRTGEMIYLRDLKPCPLVHQGDLVTVWSDAGGLKIKTAGKAMENGIYGETIQVRNESSRQVFQATVAGPQVVRMSTALRPTGLVSTAQEDKR